MKTGLKLLTGAAMVSLLVACGPTKEAKVDVPDCVFDDAPTVAAPNWVCVPFAEGASASAVGFSEKLAAGPSMTESIAITNARVKLAQTVGVRVSGMLKTFVQNTGAGKDQTVDRDYKKVSKSVTSEHLVGSRMYKKRVSPNGGVYVLVGISDTAFKNVAKKALKTSMGNDKALWQQFKAKKGQDELAAEVLSYDKKK